MRARRHRRAAVTTLATVLCSLGATLAAGCGGSTSGNGVAGKAPAQILAAAQTAAESAASVHVAGSISGENGTEAFDLELLAHRGARGTVSQGGAHFDLIDTGATVYMKGSAAFYRGIGGALAAKVLRGKWLKAAARDPKLAALRHLTDLNSLISSALLGHAHLTRTGAMTVQGVPVVGVRDAAQRETVLVASTGKPYPLAITRSGVGGGVISFDRWNAPVALTPPAHAIDISELQAHR